MVSEIQLDIEQTEAGTSIYEFKNFNARANAIDFIDFHIIDRIEGLTHHAGQNDELIKLKLRAERLKEKLEDVDTKMFRYMEQQISNSKHKKLVLRTIFEEFLRGFACEDEMPDSIGYDNLDVFLNKLLSANPINETKKELEPGMVFYQKTPARIIVELSKKLSPGDVFFDIGCGVGQVAILVNIISDAKAIGIEFEPSFCNYAKEVASKFDLANVEFINEDARKIDYSEGNIFYLYTPFIGKMLEDVLVLLEKVALSKPIKIFTYGPCSTKIARHHWLSCINGNADNVNVLCEFRSLL